MKRPVVAFFLMALSTQTVAQPAPDTLWTRMYGGNNSEQAQCVRQTSDGGYVLAGYTRSFAVGSSDFDFWLVKTNANGDSLWNNHFGGDDIDWAYSAQQTLDGGYVVAGRTSSFGAGNRDFWLVKTDENGDSLWSRTFGGPGYFDECYSVQQTSDSGYVLAGRTTSFGAGNCDFWLVKTDENGDSLWSRTFGGYPDDECYSVHETSDGGYILAGSTSSFGVGYVDFYLVKTNGNGDQQWSRTFGGSENEMCYSVQQTVDGGYILGGYTESFGAGGEDIWLVKTDANGDSLWSYTFGGDRNDGCCSVQQTQDNGYILGGYTYNYGFGGYNFYMVKVSVNGEHLWSTTFGGGFEERCRSIEQTFDGGYALAGYTYTYENGWDFWLVRTGPELATEPITNSLPTHYVLYESYPNPFNAITAIQYDVKQTSHVRLVIFNLLGQQTARITDDVRTAGSYTTSWNACNMPSGIYLCRMEAPGFTQTKKLVLIR